MNLETVIEQIHALPPVKQAQVAEFVEDLARQETIEANQPRREKTEAEKKAGRLALIGIASGRADLSEKVDEILGEGANSREGWSLP